MRAAAARGEAVGSARERAGQPATGGPRVVAWAALIVVLTCVAYAPVLDCGFTWDDDEYVTANPLLRDGTGLVRTWTEPGASPQYYPLTLTTFWLEYHAWGLDAAAYHAVNVLLQVVDAILLGLLLARLAVPGAWLAATIFAIHPVHVESVAWITERKNVLSLLFYLLAAWAFLRFAGIALGIRPRKAGSKRSVPDAASQRPAWGTYAFALVMFACALLSKSVTCSLPAALLLVLWWKRDRLRWRDVVPLAPFFALGAVMGLFTAWLEKHVVGAEGASWSASLLERGLLAGRILWFYAGKLAWPHPLVLIYPRWTVDLRQWWQLVFPVAAMLVVAALWHGRARLGRGPLVAVLFFAGTLFPALGFFNVYMMQFTFVADHFQYHASIGLIALACAVAVVASRHLGPPRRLVGAAVFGVVVVLLATLTWQRLPAYRGAEQTWRDTLAKNPQAWIAHVNLAAILHAGGRHAEAEPHLREALRLNPTHPESHNNLGNVYMDEGRVAEAMAEYDEALRLRPRYPAALMNQGLALARAGHSEDALARFEAALAINPEDGRAHQTAADLLASMGRAADSVPHLREVVRLEPAAAEGHYSLAFALDRSGKLDEAITEYERALQLKPGWTDAQVGRGIALARSGQSERAREELSRAVAARPADAVAQAALGGTLDAMGRTREAIPHLLEAVRLAPEMPEAQFNLAHALEKTGQHAAAAERYGTAVRLRPDWAAALQAQAWMLATSSDAVVRDGARALTLAQRACELTRRQDASALDALAAAQAEAGQHADAASTARAALALLQGSADVARRQEVEARLALYVSRRSYRQPPAASSGD